ncbi:MAG: 3-dehydroquinate synthase family protein [Bacteroidales bacterium]
MESLHQIPGVSLTRHIRDDLTRMTGRWPEGKIFLIFEKNTFQYCWPLLRGFRPLDETRFIILRAGEPNKGIGQVVRAWELLGKRGLDRGSLVINVGGGMLTDLGGFVASTIKRGVEFINIPTSLLAMVDASVGGKSGINFRGLKNEVGVIREPLHVLIHLPFLRTLDSRELLSGYAEMLKAGLIADRTLWEKLRYHQPGAFAEELMEELVWHSVLVKKGIVDLDLQEAGPRKALNFGHTIGHAFESEALRRGQPVPHGFAVAWGMIYEARLSGLKLGLTERSIREITDTVTEIYGPVPKDLLNPGQLIPWMRSDKKNIDNQLNFTLLEEVGRSRVNCTATEQELHPLLSS